MSEEELDEEIEALQAEEAAAAAAAAQQGAAAAGLGDAESPSEVEQRRAAVLLELLAAGPALENKLAELGEYVVGVRGGRVCGKGCGLQLKGACCGGYHAVAVFEEVFTLHPVKAKPIVLVGCLTLLVLLNAYICCSHSNRKRRMPRCWRFWSSASRRHAS